MKLAISGKGGVRKDDVGGAASPGVRWLDASPDKMLAALDPL